MQKVEYKSVGHNWLLNSGDLNGYAEDGWVLKFFETIPDVKPHHDKCTYNYIFERTVPQDKQPHE